MSRFLTLAHRECAGILLTPSTWFATAFLVLVNSFAFFLTIARPAVSRAVFDDIAMIMLFTSILLYPFIAMRLFAEENADGVVETLLTAPINRFAIVMAKFTAAMVFVVISLLPAVVYALLLSYGGNLDWRATEAAFLALLFSGAIAMALGLFISTLTVSGSAAGAATSLILIFMMLAADFDPYAGMIAAIINATSFFPHARRWIAGELDTRGLVYFVSATALFLFYAWLSVGIRGAGGKSRDRTTRRRMIVTYCLVMGGIILVVIQAAILQITGFWETGAPIFGAGLRRVPWHWLVPGLIAIALFFWSSMTYRAARRAERRSRSKPTRKYATITETQVLTAAQLYYESRRESRARSIGAAVAALVIVVNLNWLAQYPFDTFSQSGLLYPLSYLNARSWDVTQDKANSLTDSTRRTLDALQGKAHIYSFLPEDGVYNGVPLSDEIRRLLGRYNDYNALVIPTFVDPERDPARAAELAEELDMPLERITNSLVIEYRNRIMVEPASDLASPPSWKQQTPGDDRWVFDGERGVTQTLMRLLDPRIPNVLVAYGNRELSLLPGIRPDRSISKLARAVERNNLRIHQYTFSQNQPIPPECDIFIVAAPLMPLTNEQVEAVRSFLNQGGRLLYFPAAPGPELVATENDPFDELLFAIGGNCRFDRVEDTTYNFGGMVQSPLTKFKGTAESDLRFVLPLARSIRENPRSPENGWITERLLESYPSATAWPQRKGRRTLAGPFTLAYRSSKMLENGEARAAVFSSARMAADSDLDKGENASIILSAVQWLAGREESYEIPPRTWTDRRITLDGPGLRLVFWLGVVALPLIWLITGMTVWVVRKD